MSISSISANLPPVSSALTQPSVSKPRDPDRDGDVDKASTAALGDVDKSSSSSVLNIKV